MFCSILYTLICTTTSWFDKGLYVYVFIREVVWSKSVRRVFVTLERERKTHQRDLIFAFTDTFKGMWWIYLTRLREKMSNNRNSAKWLLYKGELPQTKRIEQQRSKKQEAYLALLNRLWISTRLTITLKRFVYLRRYPIDSRRNIFWSPINMWSK